MMFCSLVVVLLMLICEYASISADAAYSCKQNTLPSKCGCYPKFVLAYPYQCGDHVPLYWCSNKAPCNENGCEGKVTLGSFYRCKTFNNYGLVLFEEYENCGSTTTIRKLYAYLGTKNGQSYSTTPVAITGYAGRGLFSFSSTSATKAHLWIGKVKDRLGIFIGGKVNYITEIGGDCADDNWKAIVTKKANYADLVKLDESDFIENCACQDIVVN